jgi:hypothetical protein
MQKGNITHRCYLEPATSLARRVCLKTKKRNATVRTVSVSKFLVLEMREFHRIASNHPLLMEKMQQINLSRASQAF